MSTTEEDKKPFDEIVKDIRGLCADEEIKEKIIRNLLNIEEKYFLLKKNTLSEEGKIFNDSIHGHIELHPLLVKITDTLQFQRLRHIKQLGAGYWVFPGASHNRFEHSIGVAHLAGCLVKNLQEKQPELKITNQDKLCVEIAGLCHDLGHGPLSHLFDGIFIPKARTQTDSLSDWTKDECEKLKEWKHEKMSVRIFDDIVTTLKHKNEDVLTQHDLDDTHVEFIKALIEGTPCAEPRTPKTENKSFLYEIVANKQNGIDVDKWDYFARDCHHLGISNGFDHLRLLKFARVCDVKGRKHICFRDKEADNIYDMFRTRYTLHRQAYQHKTSNIIEEMFTKALMKADRDLHKDKPEDMFTISRTILSDSVDDYIKLTDEIFEQIKSSSAKNLKGAQEILNKIDKRELPKFVGEARLTEENKSRMTTDQKSNLKKTLKEKWNIAVEKYKPTDGAVTLNAKEFSVYVVDLDHGLKGKNPINNIYFYSKLDPKKGVNAKKYQVSSFLPESFNEELVRVYWENTSIEGEMMKKAVECFHNWCDANFGLPLP